MPELPDVEVFKKYVESTSLHKTIEEVYVKSEQILEGIKANRLREKMTAKEFVSCRRYAKYLFTNVNDEFWLVMHFGMTGNLKYFKALKDEPPHDRLLFSFKNGCHLAFDCQRKLGKIAITPKIEDYIKNKRLGADAQEVDLENFKRLLAKRHGSAKPTLMNQRIIAGIGNIYSDEILYQTGIHPKTKITRLNEADLEKMFNNMKRILKTAIEHQADPEKFPRTYLTPNRSKGAKCPRCEGKIKTLKINGRTAYYCPNCQKPV